MSWKTKVHIFGDHLKKGNSGWLITASYLCKQPVGEICIQYLVPFEYDANKHKILCDVHYEGGDKQESFEVWSRIVLASVSLEAELQNFKQYT